MWKYDARTLKKCGLFLSQISIVLVLTVLSTEAQEAIDNNGRKIQSPSNHDCGPQALQVICRIFGLDVSVDELAGLAGMDETGTTMAGLLRAAEKKGLVPQAVKLTIEALENYTPGIAFVNNNHFLVVEAVGNQLRIIDPPQAPYLISSQAFAEMWSGYLLSFSTKRKQMQLSPQPRIALSTSVIDLETLEGEPASTTIECWNLGQKPLKILDLHMSCRCATPQFPKQELQPNEKMQITIQYTPTGAGISREQIEFHSTDPVSSKAMLTLNVIVHEIPKAIPASIFFSIQGFEIEKEFVLKSVSGTLPQILAIDTKSPSIKVKSTSRTNGQARVVLTISPEALEYPFYTSLTISFDSARFPTIEVPIYGSKESPLLSPRRIFLGVITRGTSRQYRLTFSNAYPDLKPVSVLNQSENFSAIFSKQDEEHFLRVTISEDASIGSLKDTLIIKTTDQNYSELSIPLLGVVRP